MKKTDILEDENKLTERLIQAVSKLSPQRKEMLVPVSAACNQDHRHAAEENWQLGPQLFH